MMKQKTYDEPIKLQTNTFKLDTHPVEAKAPDDDLAEKIRQLDAGVEQAKIGIGKINILQIKNMLKFGTYNSRPQNSTEVNKMITSFENYGRQCFKETNVLAIVIDPKRISSGQDLTGSWNDPMTLAEVEFEDTDPIILASGQHRVVALKRMAQSYLDHEATMEKHIKHLEDISDISEEDVEEHKDLRKRLAAVK
ncbi:hypothetical protein EV702DRAFT_1208411, partial [Suillus placidus]